MSNDKQREGFENHFYATHSRRDDELLYCSTDGVYVFRETQRQWQGWQAAQSVMQKDYALALEKIAKLEEQVLRVVRGEFSQICCYCGWEAPAGGASWDELQAHIHQCKEHPVYKLEERIRVADAEEPVARVTHTLLGFNVSYLKTLRGVTTLYAHAQIPALVTEQPALRNPNVKLTSGAAEESETKK